MVVALQPCIKKYGIKRVVVSTYQSVTGTGKKAVGINFWRTETKRKQRHYVKDTDHHGFTAIPLNAIPQIDVFFRYRLTKEEMKGERTKKNYGRIPST